MNPRRSVAKLSVGIVLLLVGSLFVAPSAAAAAATTTTMSASAEAVDFGDPVTFSGTVTSGGQGLSGRTVTLERRPVGGTWKDWTASRTTTTDETGAYSFISTPGSTLQFRASIKATSSYASSFSYASTVKVTRVVAKTTTTMSASAESVVFGKPVTFSGTVTSGGQGLSGRTVTLERRPVGGTWKDWTSSRTTTTDETGAYSFISTPGSTLQFRASIKATSSYASSFSYASTVTVTGKPSSGPKATTTTISPLGAPFRSGEALWFSGTVTSGGKGLYGKTVSIDRRPVGGSSWTRVATAPSDGNGAYTARYRPAATYEYRARISGTSNYAASYSPRVKASSTSGNRSLEDRADALGAALGSPSGEVTSFTSGSSQVRYRSFSKALLVEVTKGSTVRTWAVVGSIRSKYLASGGPKGDLGLPVVDAKCVLIESGCVQRFEDGTVYDNENVSPAMTSTTGRAGEVIATALSQVGYRAPSLNNTKYNKWVGTSNAWCSIFQSWVSAASGNTNLLPDRGNFPAFHSAMLTRTRVSARVGAIAFFDTHNDGRTAATHAGLVIGVSGGTIRTIEGNTTNPATGSCCGVYLKTRSVSHPMYYYMPNY